MSDTAPLETLRARCAEAAEAARLGRLDEARAVLAEAEALCGHHGSAEAITAWHLAAAGVARAAGEPATGLSHVELAVAAAAGTGVYPEALRQLGTARLLSGDPIGAEHAFAEAAELCAAAGRPADEASCRANLALALKLRGRFAAALELLEATGPLLEAAGEPTELSRMDLNRASLLAELGRYEAALAAARDARERFTGLGEAADAARAQWAEAAAADGLRLYQEALTGYHAAAAALEAEGLRAEAAAVRVNVGEVYRRLGDPVLALRSLDQAAPVLADAQPIHYATLLVNRAAVLAGLDRLESAAAALQQAGAVFDRLELGLERAEVDLLRARIEGRRGRREAALALVGGARAVLTADGMPHEVALADLQAADLLLADERADEAAPLCRQVLAVVPEALADLRWQALAGLMRAAQLQGDEPTALAHGVAAIEALEQLGSGLRHDLLRGPFDRSPDHGVLFGQVLQLCDRLGRPELALAVMQRGKARSLVEAIGAAELPPPAEDAWHDRERAMAARVNELLAGAETARGGGGSYAAWSRELTLARQELLELHLALAEASPDEASLRGVPMQVTADEVAGVLGEGTVLVETFTSGADLFLAGVGPDGVELVSLPGRMADVGEALDRFQANLALLANVPVHLLERLLPGLQVGVEADLQALYEALLEPLADLVEGAERLVIAPHGRLWAVPYAALHDGLDVLLEAAEVGLVPSAAALVRLAERPPGWAEGGLAIAGDVEHLAGVESELVAVCGLLETERLTGDAATREAILARVGDVGLIHYGGHAEFQPDSPMFSALRLANGERLTAADLYRRRIRAELVCLAACETGRYDGDSSLDLVGLARAFLHAGARSVVASLWSAPDLATSRLTAAFYRARARGETVATSLRQAQRQVRGETLHPFFWAGFAAIGLPWPAGC